MAVFRPGRAAALAAALLVAGCTSVAPNNVTFAGSWKVVAIDGEATPGGSMYRMSFGDGQVGGRLGCNQFGGGYTVEGDRLIVSDVAATLMGCPGKAARFEEKGFAVLGKPMHMEWPAGRRLTLGNAAGTIALERSD